MKHLRIQHASAFSLDSAASSFPSQPTQAEQPARQNAGFFRRLQTCSLISATLFAGASPSMAQAPQSAQDVASTQVASPSDSDAYTTAVEYVVHFYPLWFSNQQLQVNNQLGTTNRMVAPYQVGPDFNTWWPATTTRSTPPPISTYGDGSLTVYMSTQPPANAPIGNWLPIPLGNFNIVLRVYGPLGDVADNTYVPPGIARP
jgi:hypothetical protein